MSSTYTAGEVRLADGQAFAINTGGPKGLKQVEVTFPAQTTPYFTLVFTRNDTTTFTVYSSIVTLIAMA